MQQPDETIYYQLPPFCIQNLILPAYAIAEDIKKPVPELATNPTFEKNNNALKERMEAADPKDIFKLDFLDCVVMCQTLSLLKFYYDNIILQNADRKNNLNRKVIPHSKMLNAMIGQITRILEDIYLVLPILNKPFCEDETVASMLINAIKTLGLDKEKVVASLYMAEVEMVNLINATFAFFTRFLLFGESDFSNRLHKESFCCTTEIREVTELFNLAKEATKLDEDYVMPLSLRDVVVLLMVNNLFQKNYFSDGGDEVYELLESLHTEEEKEKATTEDIRDYMLGTARELDEYLRTQASHVDGFAEAMQPIYDFAVVV